MTVRRIVIASALGLTLLPLVLLLAAWGYESWLLLRYRARLTDLATTVDVARLPEEGHRTRAEIRLLDGRGALVADSRTEEDALGASLLGGWTEGLVDKLEPHQRVETLGELEAALPPLAERDEVRRALAGETAFAQRLSQSGHTLTFTLAAPRPGGAIVLTKASRRGVRRLLLLREELLKLLLYQLVLAIGFAAILGRALARPLERLATSVRRHPQQPIDDPSLTKRRDEIGELARAIHAMAEDLEERRRATAELGADVAHEFKNPLATIAASAELIASTADPNPDKRKLVADHILGSVERLRRSIEALLALGRLEEALPDEPRARVDYGAMIESLFDEYRRDPRWRDFSFASTVAPEVGAVELMPERWKELLRNLVDNALVQPAERREIQISVERRDELVITRVRDFGPGVSPGNRDKLFQRFYSLRPDGTPRGTGLGLSIVQAISTAHGGAVSLEESAPGACFRVTATSLPSPLHG